MKKTAVGFIVVLLLLAAVVVSAVDLGYEVKWWSINGGAQISSGDGFSLTGIAGQPEAGPGMTGDDFTVSGGYWSGDLEPVQPADGAIFLPVIQKPS